MLLKYHQINQSIYNHVARRKLGVKAKGKGLCFSTSSSTITHPIISRRAVNQFLKLNKHHPLNTSKKPPKTEETPWPKSLQMVGYGALALSIPFCFGAAIVEFPAFRRFLQGGDEDQIGRFLWIQKKPSLGMMCVNAVREFWGLEEVMPEEERQWRKKTLGASSALRKSFDNEDPIHVRDMQQEIGKLNNSSQRVNLTIYSTNANADSSLSVGTESSSSQSSHERIFSDGSMLLGDGRNENVRRTILTKLDSDASSDDSTTQTPIIAIDFLDEEKKDDSINISNEFVDDSKPNNFGDDLRMKTQTWSSWQYFPRVSSTSDSSPEKTRLSNNEIRRSELEWNIAELKKQLNDPNCLRDIDEMKNELKASEKELNKIKRKWILF